MKKGFTIIEMMIVIVIIGILYSVISSNGFFAVEKASNTAVLTDIGIYKIAIADSIDSLSYKDININMDVLCSEINRNIDSQFSVEVNNNNIESIGRVDNYGNKYIISTSDFLYFTISCGDIKDSISLY